MKKDLSYCDLLEIYSGILTEKQQNFMDEYYNLDYSLSEIAQNHGVSRQAVLDCLRVAEHKINQLENTLAVYKKNTEILKVVDESLQKSDVESIKDGINKIEKIITRK